MDILNFIFIILISMVTRGRWKLFGEASGMIMITKNI